MDKPARHSTSSFAIALVGAALMLAALWPARARADEHWVGTWATAAQPAFPGPVANDAGRTLRLVVHVSIGGGRVRVRLSNTYGRTPLRLDAAHVARRSRGADIDPASDRALSFGGRPGVVIAPGASVTSDAVALDVPALSDLAISLHSTAPLVADTTHALAQQTSYVTRDRVDATGAAHFPPARTIDDWPFLTGVDVAAADATAIVAFGDSWIDGDGSTPGANTRLTDALAARLQRAGGACPRVAVLNEGLIGNRLLRDSPAHRQPRSPDFGSALGESGLARFDRDVLQQPGANAVIIHLGTNDLGLAAGVAPAGDLPTVDALAAGYRELAARAHRAGLRAIGTTLTPVEGVVVLPGYDTPAKEALRQGINAWIRTAGAFDAVIDFDAIVHDPAHPARLLARLASADHLHGNDTGYAAVAAAVPLDFCAR
ncbi:SGNH/GDSL hydrolase family protein [Scleromatobacter humisilvae]|uniref:SGNH/GDSL hydrolase family protein n=1 Tax=Scleromatobacter humisilvae TaxID=2897159 RepID=A0A9X1YMU2_9BURK|nr:SGNH/GDSL hydrolase family protein [Scleromatobacter humisilvae]MCK9684426.1 SGNH/GDSL hydrolase family protein [Scleromatobacter humisilvae]